MDDSERLSARLDLMDSRQKKLFNMVLELTGASLEMANVMRLSTDDSVREHGQEAWDSVGRAIEALEELRDLEDLEGSDGR